MLKSLLSANMTKWLQKSVASEIYASHLYSHMANFMQREGYFGTQEFFQKESKEELTHYQKLVDFTNDMGGVINVPMIEAISEKPKTIGDCLDIAYETELDLLKQYQEFYELAEDDDCAISIFLQELITIQRKSVGQYGDFKSRYGKCGKDESAILNFDKWISKQ